MCCTVLYCTVIPCVCVPNCTVYRFVSLVRIGECTAANYVNKLINVHHKIICNSPCDFRLDGVVNEIAW